MRRTRSTRVDTRAQKRAQHERVTEILDEVASGLGAEANNRRITSHSAGVRVDVKYVAHSGDMAVPISSQRWVIDARLRWNERRVAVSRNRPLTRPRDFVRLERRLGHLAAAKRALVVEMLTEIPDRLHLTASKMVTQLPPHASAKDVAYRVEQMISYLNRLDAAPDD